MKNRHRLFVSLLTFVVSLGFVGVTQASTKKVAKSSKATLSSISVNINKAQSKEIQKLPGIGESKAKKIVEYRREKPFKNVEEIKNVPGIGENLFQQIKPYITVKR